MKPPTFHPVFTSLSILAVASMVASAAPITWAPAITIDSPDDISNPAGGILVAALDFNTAAGFATAGGDNMINGIPFIQSVSAGTVPISTTMASGPSFNATYTNVVTGDQDLDDLLDSHSWLAGNPATVAYTITGLTAGLRYQVQLIGVGDQRTCCAGRIYEPGDGLGNFTTGVTVQRGLVQSTIGTFTADDATQVFQWRSLNGATGNNDPGLSGVVIFRVASDDSDGDGLLDGFETNFGLNPINPDSDGDTILDPDEDEDMDFLNNLGEQAAGTKPNNPDTDGDMVLDGYETKTGMWGNAQNTGTHPLLADTDGDTLVDGVENPDLPYVGPMQTGSDPNKRDTDLEGLPDNVEVALNLNPNHGDSNGNGTNDADEDSDMDLLTNAAELALGTNPGDADSDDDMLIDGVETMTGTYAGPTNTGTNPLRADTDGDALSDGLEDPNLPFTGAAQPGTNPTLIDTDGDLFTDGFEIANGSDPTLAGSRPGVNEVREISGLLGSDLTDPENDGIDVEDTAGLNFNWLNITSSSKSYFSDATAGGVNEGAFDIFDNKVGAAEAKWCCDPAPQNATIEFANPVSITHFTMSSSNDTPDRDPRDWQIQGSNDGVIFTPIFTRTGDPQLWTARNQTLLFVLGSPSPPYQFLRYDVTRTNIANHALNEIEYFGTVGASDLRITEIHYDNETDFITLTWTSIPGRTYSVFYSFDLGDFGADVTDNALSGGDTTTLGFDNPTPGVPELFFRVMENP